MSTLLRIVFIIYVSESVMGLRTYECRCGYGGLCLGNSYNNKDTDSPCHVCSKISSGFYDPDCYTITDHCLHDPCKRGICVSTFGGYFCRCPPGYIGHNCQIEAFDFSARSLYARVHVYYQVQPDRQGARTFSIIVDAGIIKTAHEVRPNASIQIIVEVSNGAIYFPDLNEHFVPRNVANECTLDQRDYPEVKDPRVCRYLPIGNVRTFSFDPVILMGTTDPEDRVYVPNFPGPVVIVGNITIAIVLTEINKIPIVLHYFKYKVFNYVQLRQHHHCFIQVKASGCSMNRSSPSPYLRRSGIKVSMYAVKSNCRGAFPFKKTWYKQSLSDYVDIDTYLKTKYALGTWEDTRDDIPIIIPDQVETSRIAFRPMYFPLGLNMLTYEIALRGDPPHIGGTTVFKKFGQCWIDVVPGPLRIQVKGGETRTASCYQPLVVNFLSVNPSIPVSQLSLQFSCNYTKDEECEKTALEVPILKKSTTPCDTWYQFEVTAYLPLFPEHTQNMTMVIFFKKTSRYISIECFFNCDPIEPHEKTIWIAQSEPYDPEPVNWRVIWKDKNITHKSSPVDSIFPMRSTRIFALQRSTMESSDDYHDIVFFRASGCGGVFAQASHVVDNLKARIDDFDLIQTEGNYYKYVLKPNAKPFPFFPEEYQVHQYRSLTKDSTVLLETTHLDDIRFQPKSLMVFLCIQDGWMSLSCGNVSDVKNPLSSVFFSVEELVILIKRNLHLFFIALEENLHSGLRNISGILQWSLSLDYRMKALQLATTVEKETLLSVDIDYMLNVVSKLFYTTDGNAHQGLSPFKDDDIRSIQDYQIWMKTHTLNLAFLENTIHAILFATDLQTWSKVRAFLKESLRTWGLAWDSGFFGETMQSKFDFSIYDYFHAEMNCQRLNQKLLMYWSMSSFQNALLKKIPLYYDLEVFGNTYVGVWAIKCFYGGILHHITPISDVKDDKQRHFIFGPRELSDEWEQYFRLEFPIDQPQLESKELTLSVSVAKGSLDKSTISSVMYVVLKPSVGPSIFEFYNASYVVQMPVIHKRNLAPEYRYSSISSIRSKDHFEVFKVTMPGPFINFTVELIAVEAIRYFKVKVDFHQVPNYEETFSVLPEQCTIIQLSAIKCSHFVNQQSTKNTFYIGIIIKQTGRIPLMIAFKTGINMCAVESTHTPWILPWICKTFEHLPVEVDTVRCECDHLGIISALGREVNYAKVITDLRVVDKSSRMAIVKWPIGIFIILYLILIGYIALRKDKKRIKQEMCLSHLGDNYPNPKYDYKYIIGVFTSCTLFAGTRSTVAIKLEGTKSSSKIHLLKSKPNRSLTMGSENWYVMTTMASLGNILRLYVWHNFHHLSVWKCSQILIYDVESSQWFSAPVNKWLDIKPSDDASRLVIVDVTRENGNKERKASLANLTSFAPTEIRNKHFFIAYLFMHRRALYNFKEVGSLLLLRTITIISITWLFHRINLLFPFVQGAFPRKYNDTFKALLQMLLSTFVISMAARIVTLPFLFFYRSIYMASMIQKKCTNPLVWNTRSSQPRKSFKQRMSVMSENAQKKSVSVGRFGALKDRFSPDYGSQVSRSPRGLIMWNKIKLVFFGPCQFLSVNANQGVFRSRVEDKQATTRRIAYVTVAVLAVTLSFATWYTDLKRTSACYSKLSEKECVYRMLTLSMTVLLLDALIWEPLIIFVNTICMILLVKVTNEERTLWNQEFGRIPPNKEKIDYITYVKMATQKEYKPLSRKEIRRLRKQTNWLFAFQEALLFTVLIALVLLGLLLIFQRNTRIMYFTNSYAYKELTEGNKGSILRENASKISDVIDMTTATNYASYYVLWDNKLPNGKLSKDGHHWALDRKTKHLGPIRVIYLLLLKNSSLTTYLPMKKYFPTSLGYLTENTQNNNNFSFDGDYFIYGKLNVGLIKGKSGLQYSYQGQIAYIQTDTWIIFYTHYRFVMGRLRKNMGENMIRALIITNNFVNVFAKSITTADLLIEFLPSGVTLAKLKVNSSSATFNSITELCLLFLVGLIVSLTFFNVLAASKVGLARYLKTPHHILRLTILLASFSLAIVFTARYFREASFTHDLVHNTGERVDIRRAEAQDHREMLFLLLFLCLVLLEMGLSTKRHIGLKCLSGPFFKSARLSCVLLLCCIIFLQLAYMFSWQRLTENGINYRRPSFRERGSLSRPETYPKMTATTVIFIVLLLKFICGGYMLNYLRVEESCGREKNVPKGLLFRRNSWTSARLTSLEVEQNSKEVASQLEKHGSTSNEPKSNRSKFLFLL